MITTDDNTRQQAIHDLLDRMMETVDKAITELDAILERQEKE